MTKGGIIQIVPDNTMDVVGDRPLVVGGREFQIKPGLAELALSTGAVILPQFATRRIDGSLQMTFFAPFQVHPQTPDHDREVYEVLKQYAAFMDRCWKTAPENISWRAMARFFKKPHADSPPSV